MYRYRKARRVRANIYGVIEKDLNRLGLEAKPQDIPFLVGQFKKGRYDEIHSFASHLIWARTGEELDRAEHPGLYKSLMEVASTWFNTLKDTKDNDLEKFRKLTDVYRKHFNSLISRKANNETDLNKLEVGDSVYRVGDEIMYNNKPVTITRIYKLDSDRFDQSEKVELSNGTTTHPGLDPQWGGVVEEWAAQGGPEGTEKRQRVLHKFLGHKARKVARANKTQSSKANCQCSWCVEEKSNCVEVSDATLTGQHIWVCPDCLKEVMEEIPEAKIVRPNKQEKTMLSKQLKRVATQVNRRSLRKVKATVNEIYVHDQILAGNILGSSEDEGDANASAENLAGLVEEAWREYLEETYPDADINIDIEVRKNVSGASRPLNVEFGDSYDFDTDWEKTRDLEHVLWEISQSVWEKRWDDWFVEIRSARSARSARRDPEFEKFKELAEEYGIIGAVYPNDLEKNFKLLQDSEIEVEYKGQIGDVLLRAYWEDPTVNDGGCMSIPNPDAKAFRLSHKARKVKADTEELTVQTSWGELNGTFEQNSHGWFAIEVNGLKWPYDVGTQPAASSPEEAAENLLAHYGDEPILAQDYYDEVIAYEKKQSRSARRSTQTRSDRVVKRAAKWTVNKIVEQAKVAGFTVEEDGGAIQIYKVHKGHGKIILGVERWPNGTWTRMDIDPSVSTAIRKLSDVASILGL